MLEISTTYMKDGRDGMGRFIPNAYLGGVAYQTPFDAIGRGPGGYFPGLTQQYMPAIGGLGGLGFGRGNMLGGGTGMMGGGGHYSGGQDLFGGGLPNPGAVGPPVENVPQLPPVSQVPERSRAASKATSKKTSASGSVRSSERSRDKGSSKSSSSMSSKSSVSSEPRSKKDPRAPSEAGTRKSSHGRHHHHHHKVMGKREDLREGRDRYRVPTKTVSSWGSGYFSDESEGGGILNAIRRHPGKPQEYDAPEYHRVHHFRDHRGTERVTNPYAEEGTGIKNKAKVPGPIRRALSRSRTRSQTRTRTRSRSRGTSRPPARSPSRGSYAGPSRSRATLPRQSDPPPSRHKGSPPPKPRNSPPPKPRSTTPPKPRDLMEKPEEIANARGRRRERTQSRHRGPIQRSVSAFAQQGTGIKPKANLNHKLFSRDPLYLKSGKWAQVDQ